MGSIDVANIRAAVSEVLRSSLVDGTFMQEGHWGYRLEGKSPDDHPRKVVDNYLDAVEANDYKIGVRIRRGQTVALSFMGEHGWIHLREEMILSEELMDAFRADANEVWVGLAAPASAEVRHARWFPEPLVVGYQYRLTLSRYQVDPQILPVVATYATQAFKDHHLMDLRVLSRRVNASTSIAAIV